MNNSFYDYQMYEGSFLTVRPVLDRSVNLLMFRDEENKEYQIVINRVLLPEEKEVEAWCEEEMEKLRNKLPGFNIEGKLLKHEIGPAKIPIVQVANRYLHEGKTKKQIQSIMRLPEDAVYNPLNREIVIFTLVSESEFTEYQRKHYVQVINSFTPSIV
ncbi:DcrB-related protein [Rosenbergiella epipactidis]|uniref:DcrB-related protein n=1 Tax=Rosenbergiella epipactidis TaxID=1544694 RepID=UPI001F4FA028|nr:DcrB-related protein [Rosenbergiella epipactidis]